MFYALASVRRGSKHSKKEKKEELVAGYYKLTTQTGSEGF